MMIIYGDYKDLNNVNTFESGILQSTEETEIKAFEPIWKMFVDGKLNLTEGRIKDNEYLENIKIFVYHGIYEQSVSTHYCIVKVNKNDGSSYVSHCKSFDRKFIDRENGVVIMEKTEVRGAVPKTLEETKEKEITFYNGIIERELEGLREAEANNETVMVDIYRKCIEDSKNDIKKWEQKTELRWIYPVFED